MTLTTRMASVPPDRYEVDHSPHPRNKEDLLTEVAYFSCEYFCSSTLSCTDFGKQLTFVKISRAGQQKWSRWSELNRRPIDYESIALPLSYIGRS